MGQTGKISRYVFFCLGVGELLFYSGIIFGWPTLVFVLKKDGYYSNLCTNETEVETRDENDDHFTCSEQDSIFNLIFTAATVTLQGSFVFTGLIFDNLGTRFLRLLMQLSISSATAG